MKTIVEILIHNGMVDPYGDGVLHSYTAREKLENLHRAISRNYGPYAGQVFTQVVADIEDLNARDLGMDTALVRACKDLPVGINWQWTKDHAAYYVIPDREIVSSRSLKAGFLSAHWHELRPDQQEIYAPALGSFFARMLKSAAGLDVAPHKPVPPRAFRL